MVNLNFNTSSVKPAAAPSELKPVARVWSQYQRDIFAFVETGTGNAALELAAQLLGWSNEDARGRFR